jgi:hypothetical protein
LEVIRDLICEVVCDLINPWGKVAYDLMDEVDGALLYWGEVVFDLTDQERIPQKFI